VIPAAGPAALLVSLQPLRARACARTTHARTHAHTHTHTHLLVDARLLHLQLVEGVLVEGGQGAREPGVSLDLGHGDPGGGQLGVGWLGDGGWAVGVGWRLGAA